MDGASRENRDGPEAVRRVAVGIYDAINSLALFPRRGRPGRKPGTREFILPGLPWLAVYRVGEDVVEIGRILHGAQRFP